MTVDISGFGVLVSLVASVTFPIGISLTQFGDDSDPIDFPDMQIADTAKDVNGNLLVWSKADPLKATISTAPGSDVDKNLSVIFNANTPVAGRRSVRDIITMNVIFPDGSFNTLLKGVMTNGMPGKSVASAGRLKTKVYGFSFESIISG